MKVSILLVSVWVVATLTDGAAVLHRQKRQSPTSGTCQSGDTQVTTQSINSAYERCPVTNIDLYYVPFLDVCEHWMGSRPDHIRSANVFYCLENPLTGGVTIKATICCKGVAPPNRCVQCSSDDPDECDNSQNAIVTCATGQMCQKKYSCAGGPGTAKITKSCVSACSGTTSCSGRTYLMSPNSCTDCCTGAFCNKGGNALICSRTCNCPNYETGNYHCGNNNQCVCNNGCSGDRCETCVKTCNPNPCMNNGVCSLDANNAVSCCCKPGYGGDRCEIKLPSCDRSRCSNHGECATERDGSITCICDPGYFGDSCTPVSSVVTTEFNCPKSKHVYFTDPTPSRDSCEHAISTPLSMTSELSACRYYMRTQYPGISLFKDGENGHVSELTGNSYNLCHDGGCGRAHVQIKTCCPSCFSSPCQNNGYCLQTPLPEDPTQDDFVCRCKFGFAGKYCEQKVATCFTFGEPHVLTFDEHFFSFQGTCRYILSAYTGSRLTPFTLYLKNEHRGADTSVSYPQYVELHVAGYVGRIGRNKIVHVKAPGDVFQTVSGNAEYQGFSVRTEGSFKRVDTPFGLVVAYDGLNMLYIQISDTYKGLLTGLCNNMDGNKMNDLRDCTGTTRENNALGHMQYGDSCKDPNEESTCPQTPTPINCDEAPYESNSYCGYIEESTGPFGACVTGAPTVSASMMKACTYDVCRNQNNRCNALENFVTKCKAGGFFPSSTWRNVTKCPMNCVANSHYVYSASACQPTCDHPNSPKSCSFDDTENCVCDNERLLRDDECVLRSECGCRDSNNVRHKVGETWARDLTTCRQKTCSVCSATTCKSPGTIVEQTLPPVNGGWSDWSPWESCDTATNTERKTRQCNNPTPQCTGQMCTGASVQTRQCPTAVTTSTTTTTATPMPTPPPCSSTYDYAKACRECDKTRNPNMFLANPCHCGSFFQCIPRTDGSYNVIERPCSACTCWNQNVLTCLHNTPTNRNPNYAMCTGPPAVLYNDECKLSTGATGATSATRRAILNDETHYEVLAPFGWQVMPCGPGTVFRLNLCRCDHGTNNNARTREQLCMSFENTFTTTTNAYINPHNVQLVSPGVEGPNSVAALFVPNSNIEIPFFNNREMRHFTVSLWYKSLSSGNAKQALVSNDDCTANGISNLHIMLYTSTLVGGGITTQQTNKLDIFKQYVLADRKWHHVVLTYDMSYVRFYLDGQLMRVEPASGPILGNHCPLRLGSNYVSNYYHGYMDQVCFYDTAFGADEVSKLYAKFAGPVAATG